MNIRRTLLPLVAAALGVAMLAPGEIASAAGKPGGRVPDGITNEVVTGPTVASGTCTYTVSATVNHSASARLIAYAYANGSTQASGEQDWSITGNNGSSSVSFPISVAQTSGTQTITVSVQLYELQHGHNAGFQPVGTPVTANGEPCPAA